MAITINSNIASLGAQRQLTKSNDALSTTFERLSSGLRINRTSDDAAGLAVSSQLNSQSRVFSQALRNVGDGISAVNIADGASVLIRTQILQQAAAGILAQANQLPALALSLLR